MVQGTQRSPKHAVILCHPDPTSFNGSVAAHYCEVVRGAGHEVVVRDLYRMGFDPVLRADERPTAEDFRLSDDVAAEIELIRDVDALVLVYPIWFGMPPAMLKGYVDRVLGAGFPHGAVRERAPHFLAGKHLLSFTTSGNSRQWLEEQGAFLSLRNLFDDYLRRAFSLASADHVHFPWIVPGLERRFAREHLWKAEEAARRLASSLRPLPREPRRSVAGA